MEESTKKILKRILKLTVLTLIFYLVYYLIFHRVDDLVNSIASSIANTPITMLLTGIVLKSILNKHEAKQEAKRLNTLTGIFYGEVGTELLRKLVKADNTSYKLMKKAIIRKEWCDSEYDELQEFFENYQYKIDYKLLDFVEVKKIIDNQKSFLVGLISNPMSKEDEFSDILFDIFHLKDEINDIDFNEASDYELNHIENDASRLYRKLSIMWVSYMRYLSKTYPQLFVKAISKSPYEIYRLNNK